VTTNGMRVFGVLLLYWSRSSLCKLPALVMDWDTFVSLYPRLHSWSDISLFGFQNQNFGFKSAVFEGLG